MEVKTDFISHIFKENHVSVRSFDLIGIAFDKKITQIPPIVRIILCDSFLAKIAIKFSYFSFRSYGVLFVSKVIFLTFCISIGIEFIKFCIFFIIILIPIYEKYLSILHFNLKLIGYNQSIITSIYQLYILSSIDRICPYRTFLKGISYG